MDLIHISKKEFAKIPYKSTYIDIEGAHPERVGRRVAFLPGHGTTLFTEGIHFLVDGDSSHLPVLCKANAEVGAAYQFAGKLLFVKRLYRITKEEAKEWDLRCLERVETTEGDFALPGGDEVESPRFSYIAKKEAVSHEEISNGQLRVNDAVPV